MSRAVEYMSCCATVHGENRGIQTQTPKIYRIIIMQQNWMKFHCRWAPGQQQPCVFWLKNVNMALEFRFITAYKCALLMYLVLPGHWYFHSNYLITTYMSTFKAAYSSDQVSYTASDDRVAARLLPENNNCSWPLSMLPVVKGVDSVSSVTTSTVPRSL